MSLTLSQLLYRAWQSLGQTEESKATGGSSSTVVDTALSGKYSDDDLIGGTIVILRDAGGVGAAPEGEFGVISAYLDSTTTFTIDTLTASVGSGDRYAIVKPLYPLETMKEIATLSLQDLGYLPIPDTSLTSAANQTEYTLPVAMKGKDLLSVQYQSLTDDADNNQWVSVSNFEVFPALPGDEGLLILPQLPGSRKIKTVYMGLHPALNSFSDSVSEYIHPRLATLAVVRAALEWQLTKRGESAKGTMLAERMNKAESDLATAKVMFPVTTPPRRQGKWFIVDSSSNRPTP